MTEQPAVAPHQAIVRIVNKRGLHARASAKFVTLAAAFTARVVVAKDGSEVAGTSIMGLMMLAAGTISDFIDKHPSLKMLALAFLVVVGTVLIAEAFEVHVPKGYVYFAMAFSLGVEALNIRMRVLRGRKEDPVKLRKDIPGQ